MRRINGNVASDLRWHLASRAGLSLLEVIFATGVLLAGLLGLAAVLPVASNNALQALNGDRSEQVFLNQDAMLDVLGVGNIGPGTEIKFFTAEDSLQNFGVTNDRYPVTTVAATPTPPDVFPDAFCVDPWFLTAANTLRDNTDLNGYDRSRFPCYDDFYFPGVSPSAAITAVNGWSLGPLDPMDPLHLPLRRLPRIGITTVTSSSFQELMAKDQDTISLVLNPKDKGQSPGLFVKRSATLERTTTTLSGRYSYMVTMRSDGTGDVVTFRDREIAINPTGDFFSRHQLTNYTALEASTTNIPVPNRTYSEERLGYVTYADSIFTGNGGSFVYQISKYVDPRVSPGDWMMLLRRDYTPRVTPPTSDPVAGALEFAWCQVASVDQDPVVVGEVYETTVTVRTLSWLFHPIQAYHPGLGGGPYPPPGAGVSAPNGLNGRIYDFSVVGGNPSSDNHGHTGTLGDPLYGTTVVLMKNVVSVDAL